MNCSASVAAIAEAPPQRESKYALEGTIAHECMEHALRDTKTRDELLDIYGLEVVDAVDYMVGAVNDRLAFGNEKLLVEQKIVFPLRDHEGNEMFGTVDCAIVDEEGQHLTIIDFKYGAGVAVEPEKNLQMIYYAAGLAHKYAYKFKTYELVIVQPRAFHPDSFVRSWEMTAADLRTYLGFFEKGIERVKSKPKLFAGEKWCRFCPAAVTCPAIVQATLEKAKIAFSSPLEDETPALPEAKDLTPSQLKIVLEKAGAIGAWISKVEDYAETLLREGKSVPGFKLVEKRGVRKWLNPAEAEAEAFKEFGEQIYIPKSFVSPAQLEKFASKKWTAERTVSVSSGLTMAPEDDKRPAVNPLQKAINAFSEEPIEKIDPINQEEKKENDKEKKPRKRKTKDEKTIGVLAKKDKDGNVEVIGEVEIKDFKITENQTDEDDGFGF